MRRERDLGLAVGAAGVVGGAVHLVGGAGWLVFVLACYSGAVSYGVRPMYAALLQWRNDLGAWSRSLVTERVADNAHRSTRSAQRPVDDAARLFEDRGQRAAADALRTAFARCHQRARATLEAWRDSARPELAQAAEEGYMGGVAMTAPSRSSTPLRRFATFDSTPKWLPRRVRGVLVQVLRGVDVVRLLHTPDIERRSLIVSLWLRAAFVVVAPFAAGASLTDGIPLRDETGAVADMLWVVLVAFAAVTASIAPRVADYTIGQPTRLPLLVVEQILTTVAVIAAPSWPIAVFGTGAVNWIERPDWTLRRLLIWMALTYIPMGVAAIAIGASPGQAGLEVAIGIAVTALMAGSYGLMFPATVATFLGASVGSVFWRVRASLDVRRDRREVEAVLDDATARLRRLPAGDPRVAEILKGLERASELLDDPRQLLFRRPRVLAPLCSRALTSIVPPEGQGDADGGLRAGRIVSEPEELGALVVASGKIARRLERIIKRIALEAVDNGGRDLVLCRLGVLADERVSLAVANGLPVDDDDRRGFGTGGAWLDRWSAGIPECAVIRREPTSGNEFDLVLDVFVVELAIGEAAFRKR